MCTASLITRRAIFFRLVLSKFLHIAVVNPFDTPKLILVSLASSSFPRPHLERYNISGIAEFAAEMKAKDLGVPKVSLQFELSNSGITRLVKAEAAVEEIVTVVEEEEVDDDDNSTEPVVEAAEGVEEDAKDAKEAPVGDDAEGSNSTEDGNKTDDAKKGDAKKGKKEDKQAKKKKKTIMVEKVSAHPSMHRSFYIPRVN